MTGGGILDRALRTRVFRKEKFKASLQYFNK
jgi:hypothetical protein